jgi:hypothetical protein
MENLRQTEFLHKQRWDLTPVAMCLMLYRTTTVIFQIMQIVHGRVLK